MRLYLYVVYSYMVWTYIEYSYGIHEPTWLSISVKKSFRSRIIPILCLDGIALDIEIPTASEVGDF